MNRKVRTCHNCAFFTKWKLEGSVGLCEAQDGRIDNGNTHKCNLWKGIKYKRIRRQK